MSPDANDFSLSLSLDGPEVEWGVFLAATRSWNGLLAAVDREVAGGRRNVTWVIESISKASPLRIVLNATPARATVVPESVRKTVKAVTNGVRTIQRGPVRPDYFNDEALESLQRLVGLHHKNVSEIRVRNGRAAIDLTTQLSANVDELIGPKTTSVGTIEGRLEIIDIHGKHVFSIFESLTNYKVRCFFAPEQLDEVMKAFGRRLAAHGVITWNASGRPLSVKVESFEVFPPESELPTIDEIIGILA